MGLDFSNLDQYAKEAASNPEAATPSPTQPEKPSMLGPMLATGIGQGLDELSTIHALNTPGVKEGNPVLGQNPAVNAGVKALGTVAMELMLRELAKLGHPTAAKIMGYGIGGFGAATALHNEHVIHKAQP